MLTKLTICCFNSRAEIAGLIVEAEMNPELVLVAIGFLIAVPGLLVMARVIRRWIDRDRLEWVRSPKIDGPHKGR